MTRGARRSLNRAWRTIEDNPPPGPFRPTFWRSPIRGPWLTAVLGSVLLVGVTVLFVTGLLSYAAYDPDLPSNDLTPAKGLLGSTCSTGPPGRTGCTGSTRACT